MDFKITYDSNSNQLKFSIFLKIWFYISSIYLFQLQPVVSFVVTNRVTNNKLRFFTKLDPMFFSSKTSLQYEEIMNPLNINNRIYPYTVMKKNSMLSFNKFYFS